MNRCVSSFMLQIWCCLHCCCTSQWFTTSGQNFWRPKCCPSRQNMEFFTKSWYGQASIDYKLPSTIPTTAATPILYRILVPVSEMPRAAFNTVKYTIIFYFESEKQQDLQSLAVIILHQNGQERIWILGLLANILNTSGMKEYVFLVPQVRMNFFFPIYHPLLLLLFLVFWGLGLSGRIRSVIACMSDSTLANNKMFFQFRLSVCDLFLEIVCSSFFFLLCFLTCYCMVNQYHITYFDYS